MLSGYTFLGLHVIAKDLFFCNIVFGGILPACKLSAADIEIIQAFLEMAQLFEFLWFSMSCKILNT